MDPVSQNFYEKARTKCSKIHRPYSAISSKIIAFNVIGKANPVKSARSINGLLGVPNSSMQTWHKQGALQEASDDAVGVFFTTAVGSALLERLIMAVMYNNKCGSSGIRGVQELLHNVGLDKYVATSLGALQEYWVRCEDAILAFGEHWEKTLAAKMQHKKITVVLDEMFRKQMPCLVAIEAVSNYILLEKFTENRTAETWKRELDNAVKDLPLTINIVCSDLCGALRSLTKSYEATHSPDLFHGQYEISKATGGALNSQERAAERKLIEAENHVVQLTSKPTRIGLQKKRLQQEELDTAKRNHDLCKAAYEEKKRRREKTQEAKRNLGKIYHPIELETGKLHSAKKVEKKFAKQFLIIDEQVVEAGLSGPCIDRIEKAKRAFALMVAFMKEFFVVFIAVLADMKLSKEQEAFFKEVVFPLSYLNVIWCKLPKKEKEKMQKVLTKLENAFKEGSFTEEIKEAFMRRGKEIARIFQRSSSCVEGRNGVLSLLMHRFHHLSEKTLKVLSMVHNFGVKRKSDGSTAAQRFFGHNHDELFDYLVANVKIPGRPRKQSKKMRSLAA